MVGRSVNRADGLRRAAVPSRAGGLPSASAAAASRSSSSTAAPARARSTGGEIAERLAPRYRTVVFDLRGHGRSSREGEEFGVVRFGLDTLHVLRALGLERAVLVGFSVGGNTLLACSPATRARRSHSSRSGRRPAATPRACRRS